MERPLKSSPHKALAPFESKNHQFSHQIDVDLPTTMYHSLVLVLVLVLIERSQPTITSAAPGSKNGGGNTVLGNKIERDQQ